MLGGGDSESDSEGDGRESFSKSQISSTVVHRPTPQKKIPDTLGKEYCLLINV